MKYLQSCRLGIASLLLFLGLSIHLTLAQSVTHPTSLLSQGRNLSLAIKEVDSLMARLSVDQQIGQLIMPILYPRAGSAGIAEVERLIRDIYIGGFLLQKGDAYDAYELIRAVTTASDIIPMVSADNEWGLAMRLGGTLRYPRNMALANVSQTTLIEEYGASVARQCKTLGISVSFAPVLDVNINPKNPVIGTRSWGESVPIVSQLGTAYTRGTEREGVLSVAKHFPGHGNTATDSHKTLPQLTADRRALEEVELAPFRAYIAAGGGGIMVGHLSVPALDKSGIASSMSRPIVEELLRRQMGFDGLIFTDGMEMQGMQLKGGPPISVRALLAGNDILLGPANPRTAFSEIKQALAKGTLLPQDIAQKCRRVLLYKWLLNEGSLQPKARPALERAELYSRLNNAAACSLADRLWLESFAVLSKSAQADLPLPRPRRLGVLEIGGASAQAGEFRQALSKVQLSPKAHYHIQGNQGFNALANMEKALGACELVLVNIYGKQRFGADEMLKRLTKRTQVVITYFGSPYSVTRPSQRFEGTHLSLLGYESCTEARQALAGLLFSSDLEHYEVVAPPYRGRSASGSAPKPRMPMQKFTMPMRIAHIAREGLSKGAYPGCQIAVMQKGELVYQGAFGYLSKGDAPQPVLHSSLYDVASLTKVVATTLAVMKLWENGEIQLEKSIDKYLPELQGSAAGKCSLRNLLLHESGLPASLPFMQMALTEEGTLDERWFRTESDDGFRHLFCNGYYVADSFRQEMLQAIANCPLRPAGRYRYSDIGFLLLGWMVERVSGMELSTYVTQNFYEPMGLHNYAFRPLEQQRYLPRIAPTQVNDSHRGLVLGSVDDESCALAGGMGGSAGLYASATELAKIGQLILDEGRANNRQLLKKSTIRTMLKTQGRSGKRVLGWMLAYPDNPNVPIGISPQSIGHTGFTGCSMWIDPEREIVCIFLSNRTYPSRSNNLLSTLDIRPRIVGAALGLDQ